ncbi:MAG: transposase [Chitinispirillaceae bacterium]|nr:transposase [Chitinispirillaceae bacterium]
MPRANRYFLPGYTYHLTHRCHNREFLLKFELEKKRWIHWLFEAKKRFGLKILNYCVTSNHIHLLVVDTGNDVIAKSMQLIEGRVAQEYNHRKNRNGAFWEDRYHATAVMHEMHLLQCSIYIDLNMVRAAAINHPKEYKYTGFNEIVNHRDRYQLIDRIALKNYCGFSDLDTFLKEYKYLIDTSISVHDDRWTSNVAVGSEEYTREIKQKLGVKAKFMEVTADGNLAGLKEPQYFYFSDFDTKNSDLSFDNRVFWEL